MFLLSFAFTGDLETRLPTVGAGLSLTIVTFAILTGQVGLYFWKLAIHNRDTLWIKGIVVFIWMIQALETGLSCHMSFLAHGNESLPVDELVRESLWEAALYIGICVTTECLIHAFFISRIYLLGLNKIHAWISFVLCIIVILEGAFGFITMLYIVISSSAGPEHVVLLWPMPIWLGLSILADVSIAGLVCYILQIGRPYISVGLGLLVKKITRLFIQTGLITSLAAGTTVGLWMAAQLDPGHLLMSFPMSGFYAACFMANLISRESYFCHAQMNKGSECPEITMEGIDFATPEGFEKV